MKFKFVNVDASQFVVRNRNIITRPRLSKEKVSDVVSGLTSPPLSFFEEVKLLASGVQMMRSVSGLSFINEIEHLFSEGHCSFAYYGVDVLWDCTLTTAFASRKKGWYCKITLSDLGQEIPASVLPETIREQGLSYMFDYDGSSSTCYKLKYLQDLLVPVGDEFSFTSLHSDRWNVETFNYVTSGVKVLAFPSEASVSYFTTKMEKLESMDATLALNLFRDVIDKGGRLYVLQSGDCFVFNSNQPHFAINIQQNTRCLCGWYVTRCNIMGAMADYIDKTTSGSELQPTVVIFEYLKSCCLNMKSRLLQSGDDENDASRRYETSLVLTLLSVLRIQTDKKELQELQSMARYNVAKKLNKRPRV